MSYLREQLVDAFFYVAFIGAVQGLITLLCLGIALVRAVRQGWKAYLRLAVRILLFSVIFLVVGAISNWLWMALAYERWYVSADTVADFWPFVPFGQWVLDYQFGSYRGHLLNGARLWQLHLLWLVLAVATWGCSFWFTGACLARAKSLNSAEPNTLYGRACRRRTPVASPGSSDTTRWPPSATVRKAGLRLAR